MKGIGLTSTYCTITTKCSQIYNFFLAEMAEIFPFDFRRIKKGLFSPRNKRCHIVNTRTNKGRNFAFVGPAAMADHGSSIAGSKLVPKAKGKGTR